MFIIQTVPNYKKIPMLNYEIHYEYINTLFYPLFIIPSVSYYALENATVLSDTSHNFNYSLFGKNIICYFKNISIHRASTDNDD
jgi:hypothetical protein